MKKQTEKSATTMSRRKFLGTMAGAGVATVALAGCTPMGEQGGNGWIPTQYRDQGSFPVSVKGRVPLDPDNVAIARDDSRCILCGQCIEACEKIQSVFGYYELPIHDQFICVHCGQCALWCPTGAITERDHTAELQAAIDDPDVTVVAFPSPATRIGIMEEYGEDAGTWGEGQMFDAMRKLGFDKNVDVNWSADLTIMEEGNELIHRIKNGGVLPQFTSCCPGWVKFVETYYPDLIPHLSSARSPIMMHGPMNKTYYAKKAGIDPKKMYSVAITPCTAKKYEIDRPEMNAAGKYVHNDEAMRDVDCVITAREFVRMCKAKGIDLTTLDPDAKPDPIEGVGSGAGLIFGNSGGVMEAALRTAYCVLTDGGKPKELLNLTPVRGLDGVKHAAVDIPGVGTVKVAVAQGLANARTLCEKVRAGEMDDYAFIEVMSCPGGCIAGGGQPRTTVPPQDWVREARINTMYAKDASYELRYSHDNPEIIALYDEYLEAPLSHLAHELLHTSYTDRGNSVTPKKVD